MMPHLLAAFAVCSLFVTDGDSDGKPAYDPPKGWTQKKIPGLIHPGFIGTAKDGFAPNMNIVEEKYAGTLETYVDASLKVLEKQLAGFKLLKREPFKTKSGETGERIIQENVQGGFRIRQVQYFFDSGGKKFVVTCSRLADGADLDAMFETAMKTFRFEKK